MESFLRLTCLDDTKVKDDDDGGGLLRHQHSKDGDCGCD